MSTTNHLTHETIAEITARATTDAAFRHGLLQAAEQTLREHGYDTAEGAGVRFIERPADARAVVVLPDFVSPDAELSADELEAVAGGLECTICGPKGKTIIICRVTFGDEEEEDPDGGI